jgi:hypothetical protein
MTGPENDAEWTKVDANDRATWPPRGECLDWLHPDGRETRRSRIPVGSMQTLRIVAMALEGYEWRRSDPEADR